MWREGEGKRGSGRTTVFGPIRRRCATLGRNNGHQGGNPGPMGQDWGTIDARSNEVTIASGDGEGRSLLRWNSIRRSKALE
jgi:hypothetical protein